jgi:hypothetical protein
MITLFAAPGRRYALRTLSAAALAAMVVPLEQMPVQAAGTLTPFDVPGASFAFSQVCNNAFVFTIGCGTTPLANNDSGQVVGTYTDAALVQHAFLRDRNGDYTTPIPIDAPGAGGQPGQGTVAFSINNEGVIAGAFQDSNNVYHGFLRFPWGYFEQLPDVPEAGKGAGQGTLAFSINLLGTTTAGIYIGADNTYHGFVQTPSGMVEQFDPRGSVYTYPCEETCVNPVGTVTGTFADSAGPHGFVLSPSGNITPFDVPNASATLAASINARGAITGYFGVQNNGACVNGSQNYIACGYVRYPNGSFVTFADSAVINKAAIIGTEPVSINNAGETTGVSVVSVGGNFVYHGFEREADGHFTHFDAPDAGTGNQQGTRPSTNNSSGEVTGWYINGTPGTYVYHGFVWQPSAATQ